EIGNVAYDERARLQFGAPVERAVLSCAADPAPRVELHLRLKRRGDDRNSGDEPADAPGGVLDLQETDKEARMLALRLRELKTDRHQIRDARSGTFRAVEWSDMAVLLRSPSRKVESYAREFSRAGVPLVVARGGFYQSLEISDLLNLL